MLLVDIASSLLKRIGLKIYVANWYCLVSLEKQWIQNQCKTIKCVKQKIKTFGKKTSPKNVLDRAH
jgi:hypothetical protein